MSIDIKQFNDPKMFTAMGFTRIAPTRGPSSSCPIRIIPSATKYMKTSRIVFRPDVIEQAGWKLHDSLNMYVMEGRKDVFGFALSKDSQGFTLRKHGNNAFSLLIPFGFYTKTIYLTDDDYGFKESNIDEAIGVLIQIPKQKVKLEN
ncbi:hypothetical protein LFL96_25850 [Paraburkholderia sp. D15]|uniref:hypothetical protein n=1 Tax=Paraburkholderia sp. D15 TaxID=2880218 RepID=UPI0024792748|nr:hypothetical protein [Paraburkholderia sp. D15]WGS54440.1 hypothetical protein LFL96_25850 [Paraburkholderia sp. D15]